MADSELAAVFASVGLTIALVTCAVAPGLVLNRGTRLSTPALAAVCAASLTISLTATALVGLLLHSATGLNLPAIGLVPVSFVLVGFALLATRGRSWRGVEIEGPAIMSAILFVLHGVLAHHLAVSELADGSLRVHAWYNADWFKHLAHIHALADYGMPARDIFASGRPLHYYWLPYIVPGGSTSVAGGAWAALYTFNVIVDLILALTIYGAIRLVGPGQFASAAAAALAVVIFAPLGIWVELISGGLDAVLHGPVAPNGPALLGFALYIPQHGLALALLLGWAIVSLPHETPPTLRCCAVAALSSVMTISTIFGAIILLCYGVTELWRHRARALPELATVGVASVGVVFLLGIVKFGDPTSSLQSPLLTYPPKESGPLLLGLASVMILLRASGLPLLVAILLAPRWRPAGGTTAASARTFAVVTIVVTLAAAFVVEIGLGPRLAHEARMRIVSLSAVAGAMIGTWALIQAFGQGQRAKLLAGGALVVLLVLAVPSAILRTIWHGNDSDRFTTIVPADDRKVLADLRRLSGPMEVVWQYPEVPFLMDLKGGDSWSAVLAGRTNIATVRATDYRPSVELDIRRAYRYFGGRPETVPPQVDWIYLSRKLHPTTYDLLVERLQADSDWRERAAYADACIFSRASKRR